MVGQAVEQSVKVFDSEIIDSGAVEKPKKKIPYYNFNMLYSFNAVWMMCIGARGLGKTYGAKKIGIKNAIKKGAEFVYLRRYKTEMKNNPMFFNDVAHEFPDYDFRVNGNVGEMSPASTRDDKKRPWTIIVYFRSLSTGQTEKGGTFPKVTLVIFDEFILEKGYTQYLASEVDAFFNFYVTVNRNQERTKVLFLANSVSMMNPYFLHYKFRPKEGEVVKTDDGFTICHFAKSDEYRAHVESTRFGQHVVAYNAEYGEYANGNSFSDNHDKMLGRKTEDASYLFTLQTKTGTFSLWYDVLIDHYFAQEKLPKGGGNVYTLIAGNVDRDTTLVMYNDKSLQYPRSAYRHGMMTFDNAKTRNSFEEIFKR